MIIYGWGVVVPLPIYGADMQKLTNIYILRNLTLPFEVGLPTLIGRIVLAHTMLN